MVIRIKIILSNELFQIKCEEDLDLYVEIKKIQGSVEVTSINQVEDINSYGAYTICCDEQKSFQSIENAVSLKISRVKAAKKDYSFNDLRDLESKLALIRGRSTKGAAEMDRFLNVSCKSFMAVKLFCYCTGFSLGMQNCRNITTAATCRAY